jgi:hypothetical protein
MTDGRPHHSGIRIAGFRAAWDLLEGLWAGAVDRARELPPEMLHERVDGEWSFTGTHRHLVCATDIWVRRAALDDPRPWHRLSLPFDEMTPDPVVPWDRDARPSAGCSTTSPRTRWPGAPGHGVSLSTRQSGFPRTLDA